MIHHKMAFLQKKSKWEVFSKTLEASIRRISNTLALGKSAITTYPWLWFDPRAKHGFLDDQVVCRWLETVYLYTVRVHHEGLPVGPSWFRKYPDLQLMLGRDHQSHHHRFLQKHNCNGILIQLDSSTSTHSFSQTLIEKHRKIKSAFI